MSIEDDLKEGFLFAQLDKNQLSRTVKYAVRKRLAHGEYLFDQGDVADRFYYVVKGQIKLFRASPAGNEKIIEVITAGSTFAEALMFLSRPHYPVGAQALTNAEVISVDSKDFANMLRQSVDTCFLLLADMSQRLRGLVREIDELSQYSAISRVAAYLLQAAPPEGGPFELPVPKQVLASRLSVKPETLSRIMKQLTDGGMIRVHLSIIEILDSEELTATADACSIQQDLLRSTFLYPCPPAQKNHE
ncbi:MAG: Crp/Fnr family transcriptional regulator [Gammaproteobacteria bacterium]|nr:Crp/Fnr family transcriptional regulator [Gammaproteobacteria bacterium]